MRTIDTFVASTFSFVVGVDKGTNFVCQHKRVNEWLEKIEQIKLANEILLKPDEQSGAQ